MGLGTKELFDSMLKATFERDIVTLAKRKSEFLEFEGNYVKCVDQNGDTILHKALHHNTDTLVFVLENLQPKIDYKNAIGKTALHEAAKKNLLSSVQLLIENGANLIIANEVGSTPFHTACTCGSVEVMKELLKYEEISPNIVDGAGCYPIHKCAYDGNKRVFELLLQHNATVDARDSQECTAMHIAVKMNRISFVLRLLDIGKEENFDINTGDKAGNTLLHYAVSRCFHPLVRQLVERGADINKTNEDGCTPLHTAAQSFQPDSREWEDLVVDMLRMGADCNATNELAGRTKYVIVTA